jgi:hypothetical protein
MGPARNSNPHLQNAFNNYGLNKFSPYDFSCCPSNQMDSTFSPLRGARSAEQIALDYIKPKYNIAKFAGSTAGDQHTAETKQTMKDHYSDERKERIGSLNRGKSLSPPEGGAD